MADAAAMGLINDKARELSARARETYGEKVTSRENVPVSFLHTFSEHASFLLFDQITSRTSYVPFMGSISINIVPSLLEAGGDQVKKRNVIYKLKNNCLRE